MIPKTIPPSAVKIIQDYKIKFPYLSATKLATLILKENDMGEIKSPNALRRYVTNIPRETNTDTSIELDEFTIDIPEGYFEEREAYVLPNLYRNILIINDLHIPYHHTMALKLALKYGFDKNVDTIIINGDGVDFFPISRFSKKPGKPSLKDELAITRTILERIREKFPKVKIIWKDGNHDERLEKYICDKAPELYDLGKEDTPSVENLLGLRKLRIEYITDKRIIKAGKLNIIHGHEIMGGSGMINVARSIRLKANANVMFGHFHKTQEDITRTINDEVIGSWAVGCLCDLSPDYMPINQWNLGFAHVTIGDDGNFEVENKKIINNSIV